MYTQPKHNEPCLLEISALPHYIFLITANKHTHTNTHTHTHTTHTHTHTLTHTHTHTHTHMYTAACTQVHRQSVQNPEEKRWVLRADLNDALDILARKCHPEWLVGRHTAC